MKMKTPGLLALFLATCFTYTVEGQRHRIKSMQCDMKLLFTMNTQCTCCAAAFKMACPKGWIKTTQGLGERGCSYTVKLGGNTLSLPGCSHACKKEVEKKNCCQGFWGTECYECPSFSDKPCSGHGTCLDGITQNGTCICEEGFRGYACQDCQDENHFGADCQSVCNCQHGVCKHGVSGDGSCTCNGGYTGPKCDQELPHCSGITCGANSQCVVKNGVAVCDCMPGYQKSGAACRASNPCASSPCSSFADCKDLGLRKYECTCKGGYQGDGRICQPINPCVDNNGGCPVNSTLCRFRSPGQSSCICKPGMSGNPVAGCTSVNECRQYYCDRTSKCDTNPDGTVRSSSRVTLIWDSSSDSSPTRLGPAWVSPQHPQQ